MIYSVVGAIIETNLYVLCHKLELWLNQATRQNTMIQLPDSLSWRFDEIKKIEPDRADLLENAPSSDAIVEELAKFFEDALQQKK